MMVLFFYAVRIPAILPAAAESAPQQNYKLNQGAEVIQQTFTL